LICFFNLLSPHPEVPTHPSTPEVLQTKERAQLLLLPPSSPLDSFLSSKELGGASLGLSFGHNLCFKYLNELCKPILDICIPRVFQWYKELLNPMSFDLYNHHLNVQESIGTLTPKVEVHLGVWGFIPSHSPRFSRTWNVSFKLHS
jgi:hypothetical protein